MADTKLQIIVPEAFAGRPVIAITNRYGYQSTILDPDTGRPIVNPVTPLQFTANIIMKFIKENVKAYEIPDLAKADRKLRDIEIDAVTIVIEQVV